MSSTNTQVRIVCTPKSLPRQQWVAAARTASEINPTNHPPVERLVRIMAGVAPAPEHIAVLTTKYWHTKGARLTVGFLDDAPADPQKRIVSHMNAWARAPNVTFVQSTTPPPVPLA